jgi:hypothetical protein
MKKTAFSLLGLLTLLAASAQRDSSKIDIGWLSLDKGLTQTISIKGADLEKMPFVNLSDAIAAWLYGAYTRPGVLAYVVDGNPVTDVNIYPIFDIEEVILVENAAGGASYGGWQQELVVITTKRGKGKGGMRAAAQAGLVNQDGNGVSTYTNVYHQYYLGGYQNLDKVSYGLSADWIRDVAPAASGTGNEVTSPYQLQRWRLNGYLQWRPAKGNTVELRMGYAPQRIDEGVDSVNSYGYNLTTRRQRGHLIVPSLFWRSELLPGLTSELQAVYMGSSSSSTYRDYDTCLACGPNSTEDYGILGETRVSQLLLRERLGYLIKMGSWHFQPNLNFSWDHIDEKAAVGYSTLVPVGNGVQQVVGPVLGPLQEQKSTLVYLTPAIDIGLGRALDLQAGARVNANHPQDTASRNVLPFASLGVDVLHLGHQTGGSSLKLFGSYAQRAQAFVDDYSLTDFSGGGAAYSLADVNRPKYTYEFVGASNGITTDTIISQWVRVRYPKVFWTWEVGASYITANGRLKLAYSFERRNFMTGSLTAFISSDPALSIGIVPEWRSSLHHIDLRVVIVGQKECSWETGLNATALQVKEGQVWSDNFNSILATFQGEPAGDLYPAHVSWTGGWVNRVRVGGFSAGMDLLYHFKETVAVANSGNTTLNSVLVPNVYAGYRWKLAKTRELELFVESRGLVRSKSNDLLDDRRYYTLGGNFTL